MSGLSRSLALALASVASVASAAAQSARIAVEGYTTDLPVPYDSTHGRGKRSRIGSRTPAEDAITRRRKANKVARASRRVNRWHVKSKS